MDPYLGQINQFAFFFAPAWWMECAGQTLNIANYQALFALLGTTFGGNGSTTFCLPNLNNASLFTTNNNMKYYIAVQGIFPSRS
jgi:microcystin-dependent protein